MKKIIILAALISCIFNFLNTQTLIIGVENINYFPYYKTVNGKYQGFSREVFDLFAQKHNLKIEYEELPVNRLYQYFISGKVDFKFPDNKHWAQDLKKGKKINYSKPVAHYFEGVMVLPQNQINSLNDIKVLGTVQGFTPWPYLKYIKNERIKKSENPNYENLLLQGLNNRVDGIYTNIAVAKFHLNNNLNKPNALVFDKELPHIEDNYHLSTIKHPDIISQFNKFLKNNKTQIENLKKKYNIDY